MSKTIELPDVDQDHLQGVPHAKALGMVLDSMDAKGCLVRVPWAEHLVGDPDTGVIHGGVLTALLDNASGIAVRCAGLADARADAQGAIATLDLRIDYMRAAAPHRDILCHAFCYNLTRSVAFVRATAWDQHRDDPVATSTAAFMLGTPNTRP